MTQTTKDAPQGAASAEGVGPDTIKRVSPDEAATMFTGARRVVIVPGYGMALSHAHHTVRDFAHVLEARKVEVTFGIHPLAGRMAGQMNILLAEADIPDDNVKQLEDINPTFSEIDVVVAVGASDVINPLAPTAPECRRHAGPRGRESPAGYWSSSAARQPDSQGCFTPRHFAGLYRLAPSRSFPILLLSVA